MYDSISCVLTLERSRTSVVWRGVTMWQSRVVKCEGIKVMCTAMRSPTSVVWKGVSILLCQVMQCESINAMCSEDLPKKIKEQQMEIYGLRGRINQLLFTEKSTQELLKYNANQLHKLRKIFGVNTHKELIAAAQAAQAAYAQAQVA